LNQIERKSPEAVRELITEQQSVTGD